MFKSQGDRLAEATNRVFELETRLKENAHKVERLGDYEEKLDQFTKTQQLWCEDARYSSDS